MTCEIPQLPCVLTLPKHTLTMRLLAHLVVKSIRAEHDSCSHTLNVCLHTPSSHCAVRRTLQPSTFLSGSILTCLILSMVNTLPVYHVKGVAIVILDIWTPLYIWCYWKERRIRGGWRKPYLCNFFLCTIISLYFVCFSTCEEV